MDYSGESLAIVFCYLGNCPPKYVWLNLQLTQSRFPSCEVILVTDNRRALRKAKALNIHAFEYKRIQIMPELNHDQNFRSGFWHYSLERLFAFREWHETNRQRPAVHVEADVLLLPNFPILELQETANLAWLKVNATHDCAAILFSPGGEQSDWLAYALSQEILRHPSVTDMTGLSNVSRGNGERVTLLPTWSPNWNLGSPLSASPYAANFQLFGGVFDAATFGMWLTGRDARNSWGWKVIHKVTLDHQVRPEVLTFSMEGETLVAGYGGNHCPVFCLHIHSKERELFVRSAKNALEEYVNLASNGNELRIFSFGGFISALVDFIQAIFAELCKASNYKKLALLLQRKLSFGAQEPK